MTRKTFQKICIYIMCLPMIAVFTFSVILLLLRTPHWFPLLVSAFVSFMLIYFLMKGVDQIERK